MEVAERLRSAIEDLTELEGKQVELQRRKTRLNNHKQVFLAELERIDSELDDVNTSLDDVNEKYSTAKWRRAKLRLMYFGQILFQCFYHVVTCLAFLAINLLHLMYFVLATCANLARTILDSQMTSYAAKRKELDDSLSWS